MTLDEFLRLGRTVTLASHHLTADEIKTFARAYDPQPFHLDEEAAKNSVFGRLCASGWHTAALWMRYNVRPQNPDALYQWTGEGPAPEFGPSPGYSDLKWRKPAFADETLTFTREMTGYRPLTSRPGWVVASLNAAALNAQGEAIMTLTNAVLVKAP
ncbi:MaoC family dehydratase [Nitratireductor sp. GISD-1A_MAKvit]|uniref:MaoC family dehydratase n=1 Tax=Nitratireductor sp. GISD-1A_MAKvit TaxID=3234198 RepID=UPI0034651351